MREQVPQRWVLASHNLNKAEELRQMLGPCNVELITLEQLQITEVPDETGNTFRENALIKAQATFAASKLPALADDSGLEVEALNGLPGVHSARFAGPKATDEENVQLLLKRLTNQVNRRARFVCVLCLWNGKEATYWEGQVKGQILESPRGHHGFGYDPVFEAKELPGQSLAEIDPAMKNEISHRASAVRSMLASLITI
ncbi:MAG: RdgB/HAM1 family non-canonical purine NTP pyrophosphatase [Sphingomonadales bacterium]|nr:RdgB/HAM1 family non-canonical purine NTP pyrophosphatase [Sphingomonadales bacterium]MBM3924141.1 RdgB/HAM1 family non-canonical purine NTP pyrophosphatase [Sphingomonadales bacterium]MBM3932623.1 RdgB/HAM1 family non-canonical purine NTP pyrophosphatase [Sphingomonadales bacterium]